MTTSIRATWSIATRALGFFCAVLAIWASGPVFAAEPGAGPDAGSSRPTTGQITPEQATAFALKALPGKATDVTIEKKRGKNVYVVEIQTENMGEKDVLVDMLSGKVIGID